MVGVAQTIKKKQAGGRREMSGVSHACAPCGAMRRAEVLGTGKAWKAQWDTMGGQGLLPENPLIVGCAWTPISPK